jgi:hypothetical protein
LISWSQDDWGEEKKRKEIPFQTENKIKRNLFQNIILWKVKVWLGQYHPA